MRRFFNILVAMSVAAFGVSTLVTSCVNRDYELTEDKINTEVTIFQDGFTFPLGKTAPITLGSLMDQYGQDLKDFLENEDGKYGFSYADSLSLTDTIAYIQKNLENIEAFTIEEEFSFDLSSVTLDNLQIPESKIEPAPLDVSSMLKLPAINLPKVAQTLQITTGVEKPNVSNLSLDLSKHNFTKVSDVGSLSESSIPSQLAGTPFWDKPMKYDEIVAAAKDYRVTLPELTLATSFDPVTVQVPVKISLPKGIASVKDIDLNPNANVECEIALVNSMFVDGEVVTTLAIDMHEIFQLGASSAGTFDPATKIVTDQFVIKNNTTNPETNPEWTVKHTYNVDALALTSADWEKTDNGLVLDKDLNVSVTGQIKDNGLKTTLKRLSETAKNPMQISIALKFNNFSIDNVQVEIDPISISKELETPINVPSVNLPEIVNEIEYIELANDLNLSLQASLPDAFKSLDVKLEKLEIEFPEGMVVNHANYSNGKLVYNNVSLSNGLNDAITISRLNLPKPVNGAFSYNGNVKVSAKASASGVVNTKDLLDQSKFGEVEVNVDVNYAPELKDFSVVINDYQYTVDVDPIEINSKVPDEVGKMNNIAIFLENDPVIRVEIEYPTAGGVINVIPDREKGLKINLPEMLVFKPLPAEYNYDGHSISFKGNQPIPNVIELPIDKLLVTPKYVEGDGYYIQGSVSVEGGVCLAGTKVNKKVLDDLVNEGAKASFKAIIPNLRPSKLTVDQYVASIDEEITFNKMEIKGIPDMIKSIDAFTLKDVYLNMEVDASEIINHIDNVDLDMNFTITLPKFIMVEGTQNGNILTLTGKLNKDNKIVLNPVHVIGVDPKEITLADGMITLEEQKINIAGGVSLSNVNVDLLDLDLGEIDVLVKGSLATKGTDVIKIDRIEASVDYQLEPISETFSLSGVADALGETLDFALELNRYHFDLGLRTNLPLPIQANMNIVPYYDGVADESKALPLDIELTPGTSASDTTLTKFWISNSWDDAPVEPGYTHKVLELLPLIKNLPDEIRLDINAGTKQNAKFVIEPTAKYVLDAKYSFELPLELGNDFKLEFSQVVDNIPEIINDVLAYGSLGLGGKVTNSLPVQLDLELQLLDADGNPVPLAEGAGRQTIKACAADGSPQQTDLNVVLGLKKGVETPQIKAISLKFTASSGGVAGVQFNKDCYIQAELSAIVPEGFSIDIKELGSLGAELNTNK